MKTSLDFKNLTSSFLLDPEELFDSEECVPNTLKDLEINLSFGATKNLFESTKEVISCDSLSFFEPVSFGKTQKNLSKQDYFLNEIDLKFIKNVNTKKKPEMNVDLKIPHINIIQSEGKIDLNPKESNSSAKNEKNNKIYFSFDEGSLKKSNQNSKLQRSRADHIWKNHEHKRILFNPNASQEAFYNHLLLTYKSLIYAKECLKKPHANFIKNKLVKLQPINKKPRTLFFDLDNTLISSTYKANISSFSIKTFNDKGDFIHISLGLRPYCKQALEHLSQYYEIYIFTSGTKEYAEKIMDILDPENKIISGALSREHCFKTKKGFYIKDLRIVINKSMSEMLIIDNLTHSFAFQIDNGIPILSWYDDPNDCELKYLTKYLIELAHFKNIQQANKNALKLSELENKTLQEIIRIF